MINEEYKEFFEQMFVGFTKAVFAEVPVPTMYMVVKGKKAEVIPEPLKGMTTQTYAELVAAYANVQGAQFIAYISECIAVPKVDGVGPPKDPLNHPDREEMLFLLIGDPRGELHVITGLVKKAIDGTRYIAEWEWGEHIEPITKNLILPFTN
jgi:hypothetical protein